MTQPDLSVCKIVRALDRLIFCLSLVIIRPWNATPHPLGMRSFVSIRAKHTAIIDYQTIHASHELHNGCNRHPIPNLDKFVGHKRSHRIEPRIPLAAHDREFRTKYYWLRRTLTFERRVRLGISRAWRDLHRRHAGPRSTTQINILCSSDTKLTRNCIWQMWPFLGEAGIRFGIF